MKTSDFLIAAIWLFFLSDAYFQGRDIPTTTLLKNVPLETILIILIFPFLFFLLAAFFQRKSLLLKASWISKFIDKKYGNGTYKKFVHRLKPITLFTLGCLLLGVTGLVSTYLSTKNPSGYLMGGFFISGGLGLLVACLLSVKFPPRLV